jgi:hypothetical protein
MTAPVFEPVPLPGADAAGIAAWVFSPAMAALLAAFSAPPLPSSLDAALAALDNFSAARWDFRGGKERHQARQENFAPNLDALIRSAAGALGLLGRQVPASSSYDQLLILGGGVRTMVARATFAASLDVSVGGIAGLGSTRLLEGQAEVAAGLGLRPCPTEGDAVDESLRRAYSLASVPSEHAGDGWWLRSYLDAPVPVHVLAAPSRRPGQRANTADSLIGWAELVVQEPRGARVLVVTTDLFVPFQHCDAVHVLGLGYGCTVDTVGFDSTVSPFIAPTRADALLQETRAAIRSLQALHRVLTRGLS